MPSIEGRAQILNRLKSVDGHLRGVIRMVEDDAYCIDVIKQLQAVQAAVGRVNALLLEDHLQTCVTTAVRGDEPHERERVLDELLSLFEQGAQRPLGSGAAMEGAAMKGAALVESAANGTNNGHEDAAAGTSATNTERGGHGRHK